MINFLSRNKEFVDVLYSKLIHFCVLRHLLTQLLRIGDLHSALLPDNTRHPLILPKDSYLTFLIISDAYKPCMEERNLLCHLLETLTRLSAEELLSDPLFLSVYVALNFDRKEHKIGCDHPVTNYLVRIL